MRAEERIAQRTPSAETRASSSGCFWVVTTIWSLFFLALSWGLSSFLLTVIALPGILALVFALLDVWKRIHTTLQFRRWTEANQKFGFVVTSDSEKWKSYIAEHWLSHFGDDMAVLNWSKRQEWKKTAPASIFRAFAGNRDFCPAVFFPRGNHTPLMFRFYRAFLAAHHGNDDALKTMEQRMFDELEIRKLHNQSTHSITASGGSE